MAKQALIISKANQLARSSTNLDLMETRVIEYCLSNVHFTENISEDSLFKVDVDAMSMHFGMTRSNAYRELKQVALSIKNKTIDIPYFWLPEKNVKTSWLQSVIYKDDTEQLELRFSYDVIPYISGAAIKREFTSYKLTDVANFKLLHSNKLFNLCKSHAFKGSFEITLVELREFLGLEEGAYASWGNLKVMLLKCLKEINMKSSLNIELLEAGKCRGRVSLLEFRME